MIPVQKPIQAWRHTSSGKAIRHEALFYSAAHAGKNGLARAVIDPVTIGSCTLYRCRRHTGVEFKHFVPEITIEPVILVTATGGERTFTAIARPLHGLLQSELSALQVALF